MCSVKVIILLFCYACLSTGNTHVFFESKNFYNVLNWIAAEPSSTDQKVLYSVQYKRYDSDHRFRIKNECQNITALHCDLTTETPSLPDVYYVAQVFANGRFHGRTTRLNPVADTTLGKAILFTDVTPASLFVSATLPLGPKDVSVADIIKKSKTGPVNTSIEYTFKITSPKSAVQYYRSLSAQFEFQLKFSEREYCGYVVYKPLCQWGRNESEKADFCANLPSDLTKILPWPLTAATLLVIIAIVLLGAVRSYVKGGMYKKPPRSLELRTAREVPNVHQHPERNLLICRVMVSAQTEPIYVYKYASARLNPNGVCVRPPGGYSPQDDPCQPWLGATDSSVGRPKDQASSSQSSVVYSSMGGAVPTEPSEFPRTLAENTSGLDVVPSEQLQLNTVRDANGQLKLASVAFQVERKPLLSDRLESGGNVSVLALVNRLDSFDSSDSGCVDGTPVLMDCDQIPSAPLGIYISNSMPAGDAYPASRYKQNWLPLDTTPNNDQDFMRSNRDWTFTSSTETECGEFNDNAESPGIFLEDWALQIQD
ncbi:interferon lambda receptor 1 isoform X2 [Syngnathus acus]|uniref:interferon lambda receptor 1 isoform X2 n=1 Tax=Syngnathus acus TaxID=161584 RepID=UPI001886305B|nr:interferon lambda receptor 1 isoform X2 [Syngnathus acus]